MRSTRQFGITLPNDVADTVCAKVALRGQSSRMRAAEVRNRAFVLRGQVELARPRLRMREQLAQRGGA